MARGHRLHHARASAALIPMSAYRRMGGVRQRRFMAPPATRVKVEERARSIAAGEDPEPIIRQ
jgi:hypothetical protein